MNLSGRCNYKLIDLTSNQNHGVIKNVDIIQKFSSSECDSPDGTESCPYPTINLKTTLLLIKA